MGIFSPVVGKKLKMQVKRLFDPCGLNSLFVDLGMAVAAGTVALTDQTTATAVVDRTIGAADLSCAGARGNMELLGIGI